MTSFRYNFSLLDVKPEAYEIPTIKSVLALHDNYEMNVKTKETVTPEERKEETELLDKFLETDVFKATMKFLVDKEFIPNDEYEFKDTLKRIWFSQFQRVEGDPSSSGFEAVFVAEKLDSFMIGPQNWIYFAKQEAQKNLDYRGYIKDIKLADVSNVAIDVFDKLCAFIIQFITQFSCPFAEGRSYQDTFSVQCT